MPYKSKAEREREEWMTLPEIVKHLRSVDNCDERTARRQLVKALADGGLRPLKWERERGGRSQPFGYTSLTVPTDTPPSGRDWLVAKINWKVGKVRDDWGEFRPRKWRVLLIRRFTVLRTWPSSQETRSDSAESAEVIDLATRKRSGRPSDRDKVHDQLQKMQIGGFDLNLPRRNWPKRLPNVAGNPLASEIGI